MHRLPFARGSPRIDRQRIQPPVNGGLAEYGWKPHRDLLAQSNCHRPQFIGIRVNNTEGYGFIEFEISNSTIPTVFRQPLSERRLLTARGRTSGPSPPPGFSVCGRTSYYIYIYIYIERERENNYIYIYIYIHIYTLYTHIYIYIYRERERERYT